ncbi:pyridoxal phosphate-dependent decarboxylase family protein [Actinophytocola oryzae]|uniref:L-2,4-diaminobutyrate decarboxylase n=1 Tax=Actinophytocola oryzae TaxID=502181 RepID=A0A4V3FUH7_9PSEU|nr:pyridoxal-dependent decarboxylase [Actinophytocola oryzae]TDV55291.1 L-2,4-diaminobutyrate decarboxylase [Actinophytocola oryzae]
MQVSMLAGGVAGTKPVRELVTVALDAMAAAVPAGPVPRGGPAAVVAADLDLLPDVGIGEVPALDQLSRLLVAGSVDPTHPWCAAHLHGPPLAVAAAADLVASILNPSMDSWDQAPSASELERVLTRALARLVGHDDALITSGGTESNLLGLLMARERFGWVQPVCGRTAHHSVARAAWLLGLPEPLLVDCEDGRLRVDHLTELLAGLDGPAVVVATAGTTDTGAVDPIARIRAAAPDAWLHVDAAYGGAVLFSDRLAPLLDGVADADSVGMDLHKFGWQPIAAGVFTSRRPLSALDVTADYLNAADDTEAGLPDLLGRSLRTSRRPDAFKIAVTLRALGRQGIGLLVEQCCAAAAGVADLVDAHPGLTLWARPELSTVVFRPVGADDAEVAAIRRELLDDGTAVLGRAAVDGRLWLKLTLLRPGATAPEYADLLDLVAS